MSPRTFLSATEAFRLRTAQEIAARGGTIQHAANLVGMKRPSYIVFLGKRIGSGAWPPCREELERILALPVLPDDEARRRHRAPPGRDSCEETSRQRANRAKAEACRSQTFGAHQSECGHALPDHEIHARRTRRADERAAHEAHWLAAERERWGATRQTTARPLSRMPA